MPTPSSSDEILAITRDFLRDLAPHHLHHVEARVAGPEGLSVLCAVEAALAECLPTRPARELVWLSGSSSGRVHRLALSAYGPQRELLAQAAHEFQR